MKFSVEAKPFATAIVAASLPVGRRGAIPVLQCVQILAKDNTVTIHGTDLDVSSIATCEAAVSDAGGCNVNADDLKAVISRATALVHASLTQAGLRIESGRAVTVLPVISDLADFPIMKPAGEMTEVIGGIDALVACAPFCSKDETRAGLCGVFLDDDTAIATDGKILRTQPISGGNRTIIPTAAIAMMQKVAGRLFCGPTSWRVEAENRVMMGKVLDWAYPDWKRIVPASPEWLMTFDADEMISAIGAATLGRASWVFIAAGDGEVVLSGDKFPDLHVDTKIPVRADGPTGSIVFSAAFLAAALAPLSGGVVEATFGGDTVKFSVSGRDGFVIAQSMRDARTSLPAQQVAA